MATDFKNLDEVIEQLYFEILSKVIVGRTEDLDKFFGKRLEEVVSRIKQKFSGYSLYRSNITLNQFVDTVIAKYVAFWVITKILTSEQIYNYLPQSLLRKLAIYSGFDIGALLQVNGLLLSFYRQWLEFKDSTSTINTLLSWNFNYEIGTVCTVDLVPKNHADLTKPENLQVVLTDLKTANRIRLPATFKDITRSWRQIGLLGEALYVDENHLNKNLLKSSGGTNIRTNLIAFLLQPFGQDLRVLSIKQSRLVASLLYFANRNRNVSFHSQLFNTDLTILEAVMLYIGLVELGNYYFDRKHDVHTTSHRLITRRTTYKLFNPANNFPRATEDLLTKMFIAFFDFPVTLSRKLARVYAKNLERILQINSLDDLMSLIFSEEEFTPWEVNQLVANQDQLFRVTENLLVVVNIFSIVNESTSFISETEDTLFNLPGISPNVIEAPTLHGYNKLLDILVLVKRLVENQIVEPTAIFYTAELLLREISEALQIPLPYGLTLSLTFSLDPGTPLFRVLMWLKPVYTNFLTLAIQLVGEPSIKITPVTDTFFDTVKQNFLDNRVTHRFAQTYYPDICDTNITDFGTYITASEDLLKRFKQSISKIRSDEFYNNFHSDLNLPSDTKFTRSIEQLQLDAYGALYTDIQDSDFEDGETYFRLLGYTLQNRDMIDLFVLSMYDPQTKTYSILRTNVPQPVWEDEYYDEL